MKTLRTDNLLLDSINAEYERKAINKKYKVIDLAIITMVIWYIVLIEVVYYSNI